MVPLRINPISPCITWLFIPYTVYRIISRIYPFNLGTLGRKKELKTHHSNQRSKDQPHCCSYEAFADITRPQKNGRHPPSEWFCMITSMIDQISSVQSLARTNIVCIVIVCSMYFYKNTNNQTFVGNHSHCRWNISIFNRNYIFSPGLFSIRMWPHLHTQHFPIRTAVSAWYSPAHDGWLRHDAGNVLRPVRRPSFESTDGTTQKRNTLGKQSVQDDFW